MTNSSMYITTSANYSNHNITSESNNILVNFYIQCFLLVINKLGFYMFSTNM